MLNIYFIDFHVKCSSWYSKEFFVLWFLDSCYGLLMILIFLYVIISGPNYEDSIVENNSCNCRVYRFPSPRIMACNQSTLPRLPIWPLVKLFEFVRFLAIQSWHHYVSITWLVILIPTIGMELFSFPISIHTPSFLSRSFERLHKV